jgi:predicted dehydrogenase/nucleoside-diphosphate-sugar epimerase
VTETTRKIRVGLVGAGYVSAYHARAIRSLTFAEVVGICDTSLERATELARRLGVPAFGSLAKLQEVQPDVIHILTPPALHCQLTIAALRMGCHVFVEKPMAASAEECDRMIRASAEAGRILSINHSARLDPIVLRALEIVRAGTCGDVVAVDFLRSGAYAPYAGGPLPPQYSSPSYPLHDLGVHGLCLAEAFLGEINDIDVRCFATGRNAQLAIDEWHALARCRQGIGRMYISCNVQPIQNELIVHGTRAVMHVDAYLQTCTLRRAIPAPKQIQRVSAAVANSFSTLTAVTANATRFIAGRLQPSPGIHHSVRAFYLALQNHLPPPVPAEEGRRMVAWLETGARAVEEEQVHLKRRRLSTLAPARILVTGASGFLGRALVARLLRNGESPRVLLRRPDEELESDPRVRVCLGDLGNTADVDRAVSGIEVVYHVGAAMRGSREDFECATLWGTRNVVDASLKHGVSRLVYVSTLSVLDHVGHRRGTTVNESHPVEPSPEKRGFYSQYKVAAERIVSDAIEKHALPAVILRPGQIFGPAAKQAPPSGALALAGRWIVAGTGAHLLNLVYLDDAVDALLLAGHKQGILGRIFHIVDGHAVTQKEYIELYRRLVDPRVRVLYVPQSALYAAAMAMEGLARILHRASPLSRYRILSLAPISNFDGAAAREKLGWEPSVGTVEGLRRTFAIGRDTRRTGSSLPSPEPLPAGSNRSDESRETSAPMESLTSASDGR